MKTQTIAVIAAASLLPSLTFAQTTPAVPAVPPAPPAQAAPPVPPVSNEGREGREKAPKVPVTWLGVETSELPSVVADQLGLAKGFGLVVDYVVPDGPAAAAGVQQNDIIKMLNDQILMEPDQLSKLVRSFAEGTNVTLTVLRKGAETKLTAKLGKREVTQRRGRWNDHWKDWKGGMNLHDLGPNIEKLTEELGQMQFDGVDAQRIRQDVQRAQRDAARVAREAGREARQAAREAAREARERAREFRFNRRDDGSLKTTRIDMDKAQIIYHDDKGELKIENVAGKRVLTAKDPQGRTVFSGPVETKEELDKLPPEVRQRYDKLEQKDLPAIAPSVTGESGNEDLNDNDNDNEAVESDAVLNVGCPARKASPSRKASPYRKVTLNTVLT
jgi:hypothetical protein